MARLPAPLRATLVALATLAAVAGAARAVELGGATIKPRLQLKNADGRFGNPTPPADTEFMNLANCACGDLAQFGVEFTIEGTLPDAPPTDNIDIYVGTRCDDPDAEIRDDNCVALSDGFADISVLRDPQVVPVSVRQLAATKVAAGEPCPTNLETERQVYAIIDPGGDGVGEEDYAVDLPIQVDTQPPDAALEVRATGGEQAVVVEWELPESADDIEFFQLLCQRADGSDVEDDRFPRSGIGPEYQIPSMVEGCSATGDEFLAQPNPTGEPPGAPSDELRRLDPAFLCGEVSGTSTSIRVDGLENGVAYHLVLVTADKTKNPTALYLGEVEPKPSRDFWEDYKARGGQAQGGCAAGGAAGGLAILALIVALALRRRRGAGLLAAVVALSAGRAGAQPYIESDAALPGESLPVRFNLDLKIGPYLPPIDEQFTPTMSQPEGPFEQMFGDGPFLLSQAVLDYFLLDRFGHLGVTASIGYLTTSAAAYEVDDKGDVVTDPVSKKPLRTDGDRTGFRMLPLSLGVVYRLTTLDDYYGIPIVPYGRVGLAYYAWWVTQPSGDVARGPSAECPMPGPDCQGERALGGSLGWQATAGVAVRAERLDPDSAAALHNELGIAHAGFFVELTSATVDGFGSSEKLPLGAALSWAAGLSFEF